MVNIPEVSHEVLEKLGRLIHRAARKWLEMKGYELIPEDVLIKSYMKYVGARSEKDLFIVIAAPLVAGHDIVDTIAWEVHEIVEVCEIFKRRGRVKFYFEFEMMRLYPEVHKVAKKYEEEFLKEAKIKGKKFIEELLKMVT